MPDKKAKKAKHVKVRKAAVKQEKFIDKLQRIVKGSRGEN